jgi:hypothetical protein
MPRRKPKPEKVIKEKKAYTFKKKPTGERELFESIWEQRGPYSEVNGEYLGEFNVSYFAHILPKAMNKYPGFKLNPNNICIMSFFQHFNFDNARHKCTGPEWQKIFDKEAELKEEYKFLYPSK